MPEAPLHLVKLSIPSAAHPWRLTWHGQRLDSAYCWRTKREAEAVRQALLPLADWTQHPDTWDQATRDTVLQVLEACQSAQTLRRLQQRVPNPLL